MAWLPGPVLAAAEARIRSGPPPLRDDSWRPEGAVVKSANGRIAHVLDGLSRGSRAAFDYCRWWWSSHWGEAGLQGGEQGYGDAHIQALLQAALWCKRSPSVDAGGLLLTLQHAWGQYLAIWSVASIEMHGTRVVLLPEMRSGTPLNEQRVDGKVVRKEVPFPDMLACVCHQAANRLPLGWWGSGGWEVWRTADSPGRDKETLRLLALVREVAPLLGTDHRVPYLRWPVAVVHRHGYYAAGAVGAWEGYDNPLLFVEVTGAKPKAYRPWSSDPRQQTWCVAWSKQLARWCPGGEVELEWHVFDRTGNPAYGAGETVPHVVQPGASLTLIHRGAFPTTLPELVALSGGDDDAPASPPPPPAPAPPSAPGPPAAGEDPRIEATRREARAAVERWRNDVTTDDLIAFWMKRKEWKL